jgi:hypothetical protein
LKPGMSSLFCRHNRPTAKCPICSREFENELRAKAPKKQRARRQTRSSSSGRESKASVSSAKRSRHVAGAVVTKRLERAGDDGYRNPLTPGIRSSADAERLAAALSISVKRLEYPGPYPEVANIDDLESAIYLAFLLALVGRDEHELHAEIIETFQAGDLQEQDRKVLDLIPEDYDRTIGSYDAFVERAGSQEEAFIGDRAWTPTRRFARIFERLAFPSFTRSKRFELLVTLHAACDLPLEPDSLFLPTDDEVSVAAKRIFQTGDKAFLERRGCELAADSEVPVAALDHALWLWGNSSVDLTENGLVGERGNEG